MIAIDAEKILEKLHERYCKIENGRAYRGKSISVFDGVRLNEIEELEKIVIKAKTFPVKIEVHGRWEYPAGNKAISSATCSACGRRIKFGEYRFYCPACGARMDGGEEK